MNYNEKVMMGLVGTVLSASGASLSVTELQAIVSIIVTVAGFIISVLIPLFIKLYHKIKKAKEDGKVTSDEIQDIVDTGKEIVDKTDEFIDDIKENDNGK